jgi:hypothetical protein
MPIVAAFTFSEGDCGRLGDEPRLGTQRSIG